jgi:hypothetical protein
MADSSVTAATRVVRCSVRPCPRSNVTCSGAKSPAGPDNTRWTAANRWLVALHREHVMGVAVVDQVARGLTLGMEGVGRYHDVG